MRKLKSYINEQNLMEMSLLECNTLDEVYESLFNHMMNQDESINEGFLSKLANAFRKGGEKLDTYDAKVDELSDTAKNAIKKAKKEAGDKWDSMKDTYTAVVAKVDNAIDNVKDSMENIAKQTGVKVSELQANLGAIYANALSKGDETAKKLQGYLNDKKKAAQYVTAVNTLMLGAKMAKKAGMDSSLIIDLLSAAGIN